MASALTNFSDLIDPGIRKNMAAWAAKVPEHFRSVANVEKINQNYIQDSYHTGFITMPTKTETAAPTEIYLTQRLDKTYTSVSYGAMCIVSEELQDDDISNERIIKKIPGGLARSGRDALEVVVANLYNNAASSGTGPDGVYLLHSAHPTAYYSGGAQTSTLSNTPGTVNLSEAVLDSARVALNGAADEAGLKAGMKAVNLIVSPTLESTAKKLLGSTLEPGSANNDINTLKGSLKLIVNPYITDTNCWFVTTAVDSDYPIQCFIRKNLWLKSWMAVDGSNNAYFGAYQRFVAGWMLYAGIYGSMGAT
jgi:phage major head subunit gpT-like protein